MKHATTHTAAFSLTLALGLGLAACANAQSEISDADLSKVAHICRTVMGLSPNEVHYDGCVDSLAHTVALQQDAKRLGAARAACAAKGLQPGSRDFAVCAVQGQGQGQGS